MVTLQRPLVLGLSRFPLVLVGFYNCRGLLFGERSAPETIAQYVGICGLVFTVSSGQFIASVGDPAFL